MSIISLQDVWLRYRVEFKEEGKFVPEYFWAAKGINIEINKGEVFGIIGENGAGKTTILKLISGMLKPDNGRVIVNGTISALMDIGLSFQGDLTGRENIYLISSIHGFAKKYIKEKCGDIERFAAIGKFINAPVKSYSHGMYMRLAFAIAIHMNSDILLIDDILAVGDIYAQSKCVDKIFELKEQGKTIVFISHDIELSKRLCARGIFIREGVILKDGDINGVYNYYVETAGDKNGITILEKGCLAIIFNNGKIILRWRGMTITDNLSWHVILFSSRRKFLSTSARWDVQERGSRDEMSASGSWPDMPVRLEVDISVLNEKEFLCEISMPEFDGIDIDESHCNLLFANEYAHYFTLRQKAPFPEVFSRDEQWEAYKISESDGRLVGVAGKAGQNGELPVIIMERLRDDAQLCCRIGNAGPKNGARVIQYIHVNSNASGDKIATRKIFFAKIKIFESAETSELEGYLQTTNRLLSESAIMRLGFMNIFCRPDRVEIYWKNKLISYGSGLHTQFRYEGLIYKSSDAQWSVDKKNDREITVTLYWPDKPPFRQSWNLKAQGEGIIKWEVMMGTVGEAEIKGKEAELFVISEYDRWETVDESGDFSKIEKMGDTVILGKYVNSGVRIADRNEINNGLLPSLSFEHVNKTPKALYISKLSNEGEAVRLKYVGIDGVSEVLGLSDADVYFSGIIILRDEDAQAENISTIRRVAVSNNKEELPLGNKLYLKNLALTFDSGKCGIFWNNLGLTKGLGLYSSFFYEKRWHDSSQAFWDVRDLKAQSLVAVGHWPWASLTQIWDIRLLDERKIVIKMARESRGRIIVEKWQTCLMLSSRYRQWFVPGQEYGRFPKDFNEHDGLCWDKLWSGQGSYRIGVKKYGLGMGFLCKAYLPEVVLECPSRSNAVGMNILNTDNLYEARILQCGLEACGKTDSAQQELLIKISP